MKKVLGVLLPALGMLMLILDPETVLDNAREAVQACLMTVVTSLFPFFVLSSMLTSSLISSQSRILRPLGRLCRMQPGTESILLIGLLGGYPTGAQITAQGWRDGLLDRAQAHRMLGFCCNAGPAFLFGICGSLFPAGWMAWLLWAVHILSAILTARTLPEVASSAKAIAGQSDLSLPAALDRALKNTGRVCGWVILFRILIGFLNKWLLFHFPQAVSVLLSGVLELTNGCMMLTHIESMGLRFLLASVLLSFGGLCVFMQTVSVTGDLGIGNYIRGKLLQSTFSAILCIVILTFFFPESWRLDRITTVILLIVLLFAYFLLQSKKTVAFRKRLVYNQEKQESWT